MKKLVCLVLVLALSSIACALSGNVLEDFESYPLNSWLRTDDGWLGYAGNPPQDGKVIMGYDGTKSLWDTGDENHAYYYQLWSGDADHPGGLFTDPIPSSYVGPAHMAMTLVPYTYDTTFGIQSAAGYPGPIIGGGFSEDSGNTSHLLVQAGMWGPQVYTDEVVPAWHVIDVALNIDIQTSAAYGSLFYRDITANGPWMPTSIVNMDMNVGGDVGGWWSLYQRLYVRGAFYGEQDDLAYGLGYVEVPEPVTLCLLALGGLLLRKR